MVTLVSAEASQLQLGIHERRDDVLFYTHYEDLKEEPGYAVSQAYQLEAYVDLIRQFVGRHWVPEEIGIELPTVPEVAKEHFPGSRILTHQRVGYIAVPRSCLHLAADPGGPVNGGDDALVLSKRFDFVDALEAVLKAYMADGYLSAASAAALMDTSERTLARRLSARGLTYHTVVDKLRFQAARDLLRGTDAPIKAIGGAVGFSDPAHFARMFRRIGGISPREFRRTVQRSE
jgi:AraC-like DNA-binding protein